MTRLIFVDVDDTLLTPPYNAVRRVAVMLGKKFPAEEAFLNRSHVEYHKAFPELFKNSAEMWAIALLSLPFGHFSSQAAMPLDIERMAKLLTDHRLYLISKNPPSFTRWRIKRLKEIFGVNLGDRYIACGPILGKGRTKLSIISQIAQERGVALHHCLLIDDSIDNLKEVAQAGIQCAVVESSWNVDAIPGLKRICPQTQVIATSRIPDVVASHLEDSIEVDKVSHFVVPPLSVRNSLRLGFVLAKRAWMYGEPIPKPQQILPIARNPATSYLYQDPHAEICAKIEGSLGPSATLANLRVMPLRGDDKPMRLSFDLNNTLDTLDRDSKIRLFRTACRSIMSARGQNTVRDAKFYFTALDRATERHRILHSDRVAQAKSTYAKLHAASQEDTDALTARHVEELLTSRSYISCIAGEWVLDTVLGKIFKKINVKSHPMIQKIEGDHFLFYAATHRSYLDSAVLWSILSHYGQSFPFAVGADKMRKVWFGQLGVRGGTFFLRRKFIDPIYVAVIAEHVSQMQKPGSVIEVFLEGQRSRSGLTLPPKKGIASIVWDNMETTSKVAIVPVSFTYNKIPESEKLIHESFNERKKLGTATLREISDIKVRLAQRKSSLQRLKANWRRLKSPLVSECYVHFAEPIVLNKGADQSSDRSELQAHLNEAMLRINSATAILPSSVLCLFLLGAKDNHATFSDATQFLRFAKELMDLYQLPQHLRMDSVTRNYEDEVLHFIKLPFINRKFKRAGLSETEILCINELDIDRAGYYKNNIIHFFVLPGILSYVLTNVHNGHIEELHRCFDHMFAKLQVTYFLPNVLSTGSFIDLFLNILKDRGLIIISGRQWMVNDQNNDSTLLQVLGGLGSDLVQDDLPNLLDAIRRSGLRKDVTVPSRLQACESLTHADAKATNILEDRFYVECESEALLGDKVTFVPNDTSTSLTGVVDRVDSGGVAIQHEPLTPSEVIHRTTLGSDKFLSGSATFRREQTGSGVITNLSPDGAFVSTSLQLAVNSQLICSIGHPDKPFVLQGRITRVTQAGAGVSFKNLSEESKARIVLLSLGSSTALE